MNNKKKNLLKWIPSALITLLIVLSASFKLASAQPLLEHYTHLGLVQYMKLFGAMELLFVALFLYPRTTKIGFLLLTAYLGGAIATELPHGGPAMGPTVLLTFVWIAAYLRNPTHFLDLSQPEMPELASKTDSSIRR